MDFEELYNEDGNDITDDGNGNGGGAPELDGSGNPSGTEYDEDGNPTNLDEEGNFIRDTDEPDEHGNPIGTEYDEEGNPVNLDEDGKLIQPEEESPSVITRYFEKQFGVKGGKIPFQDGTEMSLDEMTPEQQLEALEFYSRYSLNQASSNVTETERDMLKKMRETGKSYNELVAEGVKERFLKEATEQKFGKEVDYNSMDEVEVYRRFLKENDPEMTDEEIEAAIGASKTHPAFKATVKHYREHLSAKQEGERKQWENEQREASTKELQEDRETIIEAARRLGDVAGWPLSNEIKNDILKDLVEVDAEGNSPFIKEIFGDASKMFQAAWYIKYGEAYYNELNRYWENKLKEEVEKVRKGGEGKQGPKKMAKPGTKPVPGKSVNKTHERKAGGGPRGAGAKELDDIFD